MTNDNFKINQPLASLLRLFLLNTSDPDYFA